MTIISTVSVPKAQTTINSAVTLNSIPSTVTMNAFVSNNSTIVISSANTFIKFNIAQTNVSFSTVAGNTSFTINSVSNLFPQFTMNANSSPNVTQNVNGYDGVIAIANVNGQHVVVNGHGNPIMLRGVNIPGTAFTPCVSQAFNQISQFGNNMTPQDPNYVFIQNRGINSVRIGLSSQAFFNVAFQEMVAVGNANSAAWSGSTFYMDHWGNYKQCIQNAITQARDAGCYPILVLAACAPQINLGATGTQFLAAADQSPFIDYSSGYNFYCNVGNSFISWLQTSCVNPATNSINDIIFELYNEPYLDNMNDGFWQLTTANGSFGNPAWLATNGGNPIVVANNAVPPNTPGDSLNFGAYAPGQEFIMLYGGWANEFYQQGDYRTTLSCNVGIPPAITTDGGLVHSRLSTMWQILGYQQILDSIRAQGANNICLVNGCAFSSIQSNLPYFLPVDTLNPPQIGTGWHAYEAGTSGYPSTADPGSGTAACLIYAQKNANGTAANLTYAVPVMITETATQSGTTATDPDPYIARMTALVDAQVLGSMHYIVFADGGCAANSQWTSNLSFSDWAYSYPVGAIGTIGNGSGGFGNMLTVTSTNGVIQVGSVVTLASNIQGNPAIKPYGSNGTTGTGGAGTYSLEPILPWGQQCSNGSILISMPTIYPGQSNTFNHWVVNHG
jgi:hypothetical protein